MKKPVALSCRLSNGQLLTCMVYWHARAKRIRLSLYPNGSLRLTLPKRATLLGARRFIANKRVWITKHYTNISRTHVSPLPPLSRAEIAYIRLKLYPLLCDDLALYRAERATAYNRITIKNMRSQWGSCSSARNLNFNVQLFFLPDSLRRYVVAHEYAHLFEHNHSARFYRVLKELMPEYETFERALAKWCLA